MWAVRLDHEHPQAGRRWQNGSWSHVLSGQTEEAFLKNEGHNCFIPDAHDTTLSQIVQLVFY